MTQSDELGAARELRQAVDRLPRELRPARDLWPEIAGRLDERRRDELAAGRWRLAAAIVLVAGALLTASILRPEAPSPRRSVVAGQDSGPLMAAAHLRRRDGVLHAHNDLVTIVARQRGRMDDAGAAALAAGLADLERAAADIEAALAHNPSNRRLRLALASAYRRESDWTLRLAARG